MIRCLNVYSNPGKLDPNVRQRYSRLCNILLKQGRISADLRAATINLLGSAEEKVDFFNEFEMMDDLCSYYAANDRWLEYYETSLANGDVMAAVDAVITHDLIEKVDAEVFEQALNYAMAESLISTHRGIKGEAGPRSSPLFIKLDAAFSETWLKNHLSQWQKVLHMLDFNLNDIIEFSMPLPEEKFLKDFANFFMLGFQSPQVLDAPKVYIPIPVLLECVPLDCASLIQDLENEGPSLISLRLVCGIYNRDRYGKTNIKLSWSPVLSEGRMNEDTSTEKLNLQAIRWAKEMYAQAITLFDARARSLIAQEFPRRCGFFLLRGFCAKQRTGDCTLLHERPTAQTCRDYLISVLCIVELYSRLTNFYYRRIMPDSFQQQFLGRRRYWIQQLETEISFVTALEQSPETIMEVRSLIQENPKFNCTTACWEGLLLYRMNQNWPEIQKLTPMLEQMHLAHFLGSRTATIFGRALMRKIHGILSHHRSPYHPLVACRNSIQALQRVRQAAVRAREIPRCTEMVRINWTSLLWHTLI